MSGPAPVDTCSIGIGTEDGPEAADKHSIGIGTEDGPVPDTVDKSSIGIVTDDIEFWPGSPWPLKPDTRSIGCPDTDYSLPEDGPGSPSPGGPGIVDKHSIGIGTEDGPGLETVDKYSIGIGTEDLPGPDTVAKCSISIGTEDGPGPDIVDKYSIGIGTEDLPGPDTVDKCSIGIGTEDIEGWPGSPLPPKPDTRSIGRQDTDIDTDESLPDASLPTTQSEGKSEPYLLRGWPRFSIVQEKVIIKKKRKPKRVVAWKPESRLDNLRHLYDPIGATFSGNAERDDSPKLARLHHPKVSVNRPIHGPRYLTLAPWSKIPQPP